MWRCLCLDFLARMLLTSGQCSGMWWCSWWLCDGVDRFWIHAIPLLQALLCVPFEDIMTEMEKTISMLLEEVYQKVWHDMASPLDPGQRTTMCKYRMPRGAGQRPLSWSANGQGQCCSGQHQWLERKGPFSRRCSAHDIGHRQDAIKSSHKAVFSLVHADGQQLWPQGLVPSRLYSLLLNI